MPWKYNVWTAVAMMVTSLIQLIEYRAWKAIDVPPDRQAAARQLRPALLLQPAVNWLLGAYALGLPWMYVVGLGYLAWWAYAVTHPQPHADISRGTKGHLAWSGDTRSGRTVLHGLEGWAYMIGLFAPLALAFMVGNATYGLVMMLVLAATFSYSLLMYPCAEASSLWCFWGLLYVWAGASLNWV